MSYHQDIIQSVLLNPTPLINDLSILKASIQTEVAIGNGDIDILVEGNDKNSNLERQCVIEVKSHSGLIPHFKKIQLPKYIQRYPRGEFFALIGDPEKSLQYSDFELRGFPKLYIVKQ